MTGVKVIQTDKELETMVQNFGGGKCLVIYFYLPWCPSCLRMSPVVNSIADKNPDVLFLKVDAEKCVDSARKHRITKVPLFILFNNLKRVDRVEGAAALELERKIQKIQGDLSYHHPSAGAGVGNFGPADLEEGSTLAQRAKASNNRGGPSTSTGAGKLPSVIIPTNKLTDLNHYLDRRNCRVLNDLVPTAFQGFLEGDKLVSGKGVGRMLLIYAFSEKMMIHSFKIQAPVHSGPRVLKFFTSVGKVADINDIYDLTPVQEVTLNADDLSGDHYIELKHSNFVGVTGIQIYITENMTKSRRIEIEHLFLHGAPLSLSEPTRYAK